MAEHGDASAHACTWKESMQLQHFADKQYMVKEQFNSKRIQINKQNSRPTGDDECMPADQYLFARPVSHRYLLKGEICGS